MMFVYKKNGTSDVVRLCRLSQKDVLWQAVLIS